MSVRYQVRHLTRYVYAHAAASGRHLAHLTPRITDWQRLESHALRIAPLPTEDDPPQIDYFGNTVRRWAIGGPHRKLEVEAESTVAIDSQAENWATAAAWEGALGARAAALVEFTLPSPYVPLLAAAADYARPSFTAGRPLDEALHDLVRRMRADFVFDPTATTIATPIVDVMRRRRGVCQDFAHLQIACLRSLGLAARYVSGYLSTLPPPGKLRLVGADATHAWVSIYCGEQGWIDLDPTNDQIPAERHVLLAWGRDFFDVSPVKGVILGGGHHSVSVSVDVRPI